MNASDLLRALDMPERLQSVQDGYWKALREWEALDAAYQLVIADLLAREGEQP